MDSLELLPPEKPVQSDANTSNQETETSKKPKYISRSPPISPAMLSMLAEFYHKHFASYCSSKWGFKFKHVYIHDDKVCEAARAKYPEQSVETYCRWYSHHDWIWTQRAAAASDER